MAARTPNCYDGIENLDEAVSPWLDAEQRYVMVGGIASGAIRDPESRFSHTGQRLWAADGSAEPILRENGSTRDVDLVVCGILPDEQADEIKSAVASSIRKTIHADMIVSVFGFDKREELTAKKRLKSAALAWTSKRTIDEYGVHRYELFPLETVVPAATYRPWSLVLPSGSEVPVLNPAGHYMAYWMRSISGLRHKDERKVCEMGARIMGEPDFVDALKIGDFATWAKFATNLQRLRSLRLDKWSPSFREDTSWLDARLAHYKAKGLAAAESNETILNIATKDWAQRVLNFGINAR